MSSIARSRTTRTLMLLLATLALMVPTAALADPPDESGVVERVPVLSTWIAWDADLLVFTGPPVDAATCLGLATEGFDYEEFLTPISTVVTTTSGSQLYSVTHTDRIWVYDDEGTSDPFDWIFGKCEAMLGADAPAPDPLAHGDGLVHVNSRVDADGVQHGTVRLTATVTTADGRDVHLGARGDIGALEGDTITYGG